MRVSSKACCCFRFHADFVKSCVVVVVVVVVDILDIACTIFMKNNQ